MGYELSVLWVLSRNDLGYPLFHWNVPSGYLTEHGFFVVRTTGPTYIVFCYDYKQIWICIGNMGEAILLSNILLAVIKAPDLQSVQAIGNC